MFIASTSASSVVSYWNSTSNHNGRLPAYQHHKLYLIEILHQTTTVLSMTCGRLRCILLKFYIKPQHKTNRLMGKFSCILLKFYIKPQLRFNCLILLIVVSYWNSTSNHNVALCAAYRYKVVSYWNSTSNHNCVIDHYRDNKLYLIEILHQTTTFCYWKYWCRLLYLIEILHQTTTIDYAVYKFSLLYLIEILHQTTTLQTPTTPIRTVVSYWNSTSNHNLMYMDCYRNYVVSYWNSTSNHNIEVPCNSKFTVVSYWNSTSNHNTPNRTPDPTSLYLIEILHQTTTYPRCYGVQSRCILLKFYIKPQLAGFRLRQLVSCILLKFYIKPQLSAKSVRNVRVVSYWNSTSNHNDRAIIRNGLRVVSYWNSTSNHNSAKERAQPPLLYLIEILHQTTTYNAILKLYYCCILLKFYIKPQL